MVEVEAIAASTEGKISLEWKPACHFPDYYRVVAKIPISKPTFDELFNGRSGYRAQYYLSPEEGVLYNRDVLSVLKFAIKKAFERALLTVPWTLVERSLAGPHSKIWIFDEKPAFDEAEDETLNPTRWVENRATRGRKAPLPENCAIDLKGAFIHPDSLDVAVDELKADRACDLFRKGYT